MKLTIEKRTSTKKSSNKKLRAEGRIPVVIYGHGQETMNASIEGIEMQKILSRLQKGSLPTTVFSLESAEGAFKAVVKDIQYHPTTYDILHLDFERLSDDVKVRVKVPLRPVGMQNCHGIRQGGVLRPVLRHLPVECYPKDLPKEFFVDVSDLGIKQGKRLHSVEIPEAVRPLMDLNEVAVLIAKR